MYQLNDKQIDFILNDIRARGVEMESLQNDLLDHVCCIIEQNLEANGNFESFYSSAIKRFYKQHLWEIEEETISLLTFKNYYTMKKIMISSGTLSAAALSLGLVFKFLYWPGASVLIVLGIVSASLVFLPLMFTLRIKEKQNTKDKMVLGVGMVVSSLLAMHVLFKVMHWPYANFMGIVSIALLLLVFLPLYFFSGIRHPETKINTIVSSALIVLGCGLVLTLVRSPKAGRLQNIRNTTFYLRNEALLNAQRQSGLLAEKDSSLNSKIKLAKDIDADCEALKAFLLESETGNKEIGSDFEARNNFISDSHVEDYFNRNVQMQDRLAQLTEKVAAYEQTVQLPDNSLPVSSFSQSLIELKQERSSAALNTLIQLQMFVWQHHSKSLEKL